MLLIIIFDFLKIIIFYSCMMRQCPRFTKISQQISTRAFQNRMFSYDRDANTTFKVLLAHMPPDSSTTHLFFSSKKPNNKFNIENKVWFKRDMNLCESPLYYFICDMATLKLEGDFTNKFGRVTRIT
jgi:hypothetical protein